MVKANLFMCPCFDHFSCSSYFHYRIQLIIVKHFVITACYEMVLLFSLLHITALNYNTNKFAIDTVVKRWCRNHNYHERRRSL